MKSVASYEPKLGTHLPALDAVRGLAILLVTVYRFNLGPDDPSLPGRWTFRLFGLGTAGVDLFFVLSGFLITGILYDAKATENYFRNFYMRRLLRIFPLYYGVLFLAFVVGPALAPTSTFQSTEAHQGWLWLYGANFYLAAQNSWTALGWFGHFWSLAVEEHFYLAWPLVIWFTSRRGGMIACGVCAAIASVGRLAFVAAGNAVAVEALTFCRLDALATGGFLALAARGPAGVRGLVRPSAIMAAVSGVVLVLVEFRPVQLLRMSHAAKLSLEFGLLPPMFGGILILAVAAPPSSWFGRVWHTPVLRFFGKYSYGLYVFENLLIPLAAGFITAERMVHLVGSIFFGRILYLVAMTALSTGVAFASWHLYEKHFLKLKDAFAPGAAPTLPTFQPLAQARQ
jgi:peptidoglycan/LPS O-acetylase OafA/YrhL